MDRISDAETRAQGNRLKLGLLVGTALALLAGTALVLLGMRSDDRGEGVSSSCGSLLPTRLLESFPQVGEVTLDGAVEQPTSALWRHECAFAIEVGDGDRPVIDVKIGAGEQVASVLQSQAVTHVGGAFVAVPLEAGWNGVMFRGSMAVDTTVVLDCERENSQIVVSTSASLPGERFQDAGERGWLARLTTLTARNAAKEKGCDAKFGQRVDSVPKPPSGTVDGIPVEDARGTCRSLAGIAEHVREAGGSQVLETNRGSAPVEDCIVLNKSGKEIFRATAFYGPFSGGVAEQAATETLQRVYECGGASDRAGFAVQQLSHRKVGSGSKFMNTFLEAFSREFRHDCRRVDSQDHE
jgi:hypothetical protein